MAASLLTDHPLEELTVDALAGGAQISRSAFYFYFDSLEAVVRALAVRLAGELDRVIEDPPAGWPPQQVVRRHVDNYLDRWRKHGHILRAMHALYETDPWMRTFCDETTVRARQRLAAMIRREQESGRAMKGFDAAEVADVLGAMAWRCGYELSLRAPSKADERVAAAMTLVWVRALYGTP
ncbi:MAG: TetR/AcrR family transcriptional regulator [Acidimicrobiales bacterium]